MAVKDQEPTLLTEKAAELATYIVEKGKPLLTEVK